MEAIELIELIGRGEDSRTQLKRDLNNPESLAGDLVAFSNFRGGRIIVGVDDRGSILGLAPEDIRRINQLLSNTATDWVRPSLIPGTELIRTSDGRVVMLITVPEGISKPYCDKNGVFWMKSGADKRRLTSREEIQRLLQSAELVHADEIPVEGTTVDDIDRTHFEKFFSMHHGVTLGEVLERDEISFIQLLHNLGLARNQKLNLAGLLLFGERPQRHRPALVVKAVSFVGNDPAGTRYRDSEDLSGCLRDLHRGMMSFLMRNLRRIQGEKGINTEGDLEIPAPALEELVVNMLLHRDYFVSAPWKVFIFDNRIELISPGSLPNNLTIENIRNGVSVIRNPLIASFGTKELPYRGIGTGIRRALAAFPTLGLVSDHDGNRFIATLPRPG
jgi:ATP-dependent DNA helicase RecG